jgi:cell shape-determining protein MreC
MERYVETTAPGYVIDNVTGAVINTNEQEYLKVLAQRQKTKQFNQLQSEVDSLKTDIKDIKELLIQALSGR